MSREKFDEVLLNNIINHISGGSIKAITNIKDFHMKEVVAVRDYMADILVATGYTDAHYINYLFHTALNELGINEGLLTSSIVISKPAVASLVK